MNNPFLSDRNIFSKVTNPIKKKSQTQKKQQIKKPQNSMKPAQVNRQSFVTSYNFQNKDRDSQNKLNIAGNMQHRVIPTQKMTFGVPSQQLNNYSENATLKNNAKSLYSNSSLNYQPSVQNNQRYSKPQNHLYNQNKIKEKQKIHFQDNSSLATLNNDMPKSNHFDNYSPIVPRPSPQINDSQFINIQALGEDLNRFLAESKNQEQLCKILGIEMKGKDKINERKTVNEGRIPYENEISNQNKAYEINNQLKVKANPFSKPLPNFQKQKVLEKPKNNIFQSFKPNSRTENQSQKSSKEYIPTFNYAGVQNQPMSQSRQYDLLPSFKKIDGKQLQNKREQIMSYEPLEQQQNLEVFNYSKANIQKPQNNLQQIINRQMMGLALSGKYRTFLTSSQKIVTVKYIAQQL